MVEKRRDKKGRILRKGESQRTDGRYMYRYMYRYMDYNGEYQTVYSWRLVETDSHPKGKRQEDALRTKEEQIEENNRDLISNISSSITLNELFAFFFETSCFCGECIGLTWSDVDFHKRFIKIDHQLIYELDENDERRFQVVDPKTIKSIRKVPLSMRALQEIMEHQNLALTMKVYNHVDEKRMCDEMDKLDAVRNVRKDMGNDNNGKAFKVS